MLFMGASRKNPTEVRAAEARSDGQSYSHQRMASRGSCQSQTYPSVVERSEGADRRSSPPRAPAKKPVPPDQTNAENFYYVKQMQAKTPMVFVLRDGETLHGVIEWYDRCCLKVNRSEGPNILLYKPAIKYMYKEN